MSWVPIDIAAKLLLGLGNLLPNKQKDKLEADRKLFQRFLSELPSEGCIAFLEDHHFGNIFQIRMLDPLHVFIEVWCKAEFRFHDSKVDAARDALVAASKRFLEEIAGKTHPHFQPGFQVIYKYYNEGPEVKDPEERRRLDQQIKEISAELDALSTEVFKRHQAFVTVGRKRLRL